MSERDYFDIDGVEGEDVNLEEEAEVEAVAEASAELAPEPVQNVVSRPPPEIPLDMHVKSAQAGGQYPTEDPGDPTTIWSPSPGVIGSHNQGFRKI